MPALPEQGTCSAVLEAVPVVCRKAQAFLGQDRQAESFGRDESKKSEDEGYDG